VHEEVKSLQPQMEYHRDLADRLLTDAPEDTEGKTQVLDDVNKIRGRYDKLMETLEDWLSDMETGTAVIFQFQVQSYFVLLVHVFVIVAYQDILELYYNN